MNKRFTRLLTVPTLIAIILTSTAFASRPIFGPAPLNDAGFSAYDRLVSGVTDGAPLVRTEQASGLQTTTFDTLVGTVTVNLPDDLAAGDTISGTVIAEPKKQSAPKDPTRTDTPDQAAGLDELNGYVVEIGSQENAVKAPIEDPGCNDGKRSADDHSINICRKWSIPGGVSRIPVVLKDKVGKVIGQTDIPVSPKQSIAKVAGPSGLPQYPPKYFTPPLGQAGKPLSVRGEFDGDFANAQVKIADQTAKFLASSPRKLIVESPRDLNGMADIEVLYKGQTVTKCVYRNISVRLAADKLNLVKGEQTSLTVTLAGLIGLLSPVVVRLSNKSPGTVSMAGGEMQSIDVNPADVNGDVWKTTRGLTGVKAGGFSINALIDPASVVQGNLTSCDPVKVGTMPDGPKPPSTGFPPGPPPPAPGPLDADGNPRTNDGPPQPVNQLRGTYRVTFMGFTVNHASNHGLLQHHDAVTFFPDVRTYSTSGRQRNFIQGGRTNIIGRNPPNRVQGGSAGPSGGLLTGDGYPTQTPWVRTVPDSTGAPGTIPPTVYFENEIAQNTDAAVIIPDIWTTDGFDDRALRNHYLDELNRSRPAVGRAVVGMLTRAPRLELGNYLRPGAALGIGSTVSVPLGVPQERPIGVQPVGTGFGFTPQVLVLTYDSAEFIIRTSFGFGRGIVPVRYVDPPGFDGDYTLFLKVERMDTRPPCAASLTGAHVTGTATLQTTNGNAPGPYSAAINITADLTNCRETIRISEFPAITTEPFPIELPTGTLQNRTTVTMTGGGTGTLDRATGQMNIPVTLHLAHSVEARLGAFAAASDLRVTLTTEGPGGHRLSDGRFTLISSGVFARGFLGSSTGTIVVNGSFSPSP